MLGADNDTTYVSRPVPGSGSVTFGVSGASGTAPTAVTIHVTAKVVSGATATLVASLYDGVTLKGTGTPRIMTTSYSSYSDTFSGLAFDSLANLRVKLDVGGEGTASSIRVTYVDADATSSPPTDTATPSVPTGLTATVISNTEVDLSWTASTDNVAVQGYKIFHGTTQVGTLVANRTTFKDTGLTAGTLYTYKISAIDWTGNESAKTSGVSATTTGADTTAPTVATSVAATAVAWNDVLTRATCGGPLGSLSRA
jgi:hypothetical protein